jgi:hypothetical protein
LTDPINVSSDIYEIEEEMVELAGKYFNMDPDDPESLNTLKSGLFGYFTEAISNYTALSAYHKDALYEEYFLNTAQKPESIYNYAKRQDVTINLSQPAQMRLSLAIKRSDIIEYSISYDEFFNSSNNIKDIYKDRYNITRDYLTEDFNYFIISNNNNWNIGDYNFMLDRDIILTINNENNTINVQYIINDNKEHIESIETPYIDSIIDSINGEEFLIFYPTVYQMEKNTLTYNVFSQDQINNIFYDIDYDDQLAIFNVIYNLGDTSTVLPKYFNEQTSPDEDQYCYYTFLDDDTYQIYFSALPREFKPAFNSEIAIETYTTLGEEGNFTFDTDQVIDFRFISSDKQDVNVICMAMTDSSNGQDQLDLVALKEMLMRDFVTRENLITNIDLNNFFNDLINQISVNDSTLEFIKKRDDILRRIFSSFILLKDKDLEVIPSNTLNIKTNKEILEENNNLLNTGFNVLFERDPEEDYGFFLRNSDDIANYSDKDYFKYSLPYTTKSEVINGSPFINYYRDYVNEEYFLGYDFVSTTFNYEFIINTLFLNRNSIQSPILTNDSPNVYELAIEIQSTNIPSEYIGDPNRLRTIAILKDEKETPVGYCNLNYIPDDSRGEMIYGTNLETNNNFDGNNDLPIINGFRDLNGNLMNEVYINSDMNIDIVVLLNEGTNTTKNSIYLQQMDDAKADSFTDFDSNNYGEIIRLNSRELVTFFKSLDSIISSDIYYDEKQYEFIIDDTSVIDVNDDLTFNISDDVDTENVVVSLTSGMTINDALNLINDTINDNSNIVTSSIDLDNNKVMLSSNYLVDITVIKGSTLTSLTFTNNRLNNITINSMPMIGYSYLDQESKYDSLYNLLSTFEFILEDNLNSLQNNTDLDMKFYNTFGMSQYYEIEEGGQRFNSDVNMSVSLNIKLNQTIDEKEIIDFIATFMENTNNSDSRVISISNLITELENNFDEIDYIEFNTLNEHNTQKIIYTYEESQSIQGASHQQLINFVPEYININDYTTSDAEKNITISYI